MADPTDLQDLARRYVELWQEQMAATAADPAAAQGLARFIEMLGALAGAGAASRDDPGLGAHAGTDGADGAAAAAAAPAERGDALGRIEARLAVVEERLRQLEAAVGARPPRPRTGRRQA